MAHILVVDDHKNTCLTLGMILRSEGHEVEVAGAGRDALEMLAGQRFDIVITDLRLGDIDGTEVLARARTLCPSTEVIVITAFGSITSAVKAMKLGAYDYITKPLQREKILAMVRTLTEQHSLPQGKHRQSTGPRDIVPIIIGQTAAMKDILTLAEDVARADVPVLICGESGTGKELVARYIHCKSARVDKPFVAINCGALPESLQESEFFGHVKGAFTGAIEKKKGLFEEADGGTILLDEIGEMSLPSQVKLLRVLQDGEMRPVGSNKPQHVNVRILASTNQSLPALVKRDRFRKDLLFRIDVIRLVLPPLRERLEDIPALVDFFIRKHAERFQRPGTSISASALCILQEHTWPGNIRELENCIRRAVLLCKRDTIDASDLGVVLGMYSERGEAKLLAEQERELILRTLERTNWNRKRAALELGIGTTTLWRKIKRFGLMTGDR